MPSKDKRLPRSAQAEECLVRGTRQNLKMMPPTMLARLR